jgi:Fe-S cluster assembly protein SufD
MNTKATMIQNSEYTISDISPELMRGPQWLRDLRNKAREDFNQAPLPRRGLHLWRYTDPGKFMYELNDASDTTYGDNYDVVEKIEQHHVDEGTLAGLVTDLGGREIKRYGTEALAEKGVIIMPLSEAIEKQHDLVEKYLYQAISSQTGKFEAMNGALWNDGIFVYVPNGQVIEQPLHLLREAGMENSATFPRLLVVVGKNAGLTLVDEYGGGSMDEDKGISFVNGAVEIFGLAESKVRYVSLQRQTSATNSYLTHRAQIEQGASMLTIPLVFGGSLCKQNFGVRLNGAGAHSDIYGLLFGSMRQHFDNHTLHHHAHGSTSSNIDFKVVLKDRAQSAYTGLIRIENGARNCEAYQENRNLLLNPGTKAQTIPELEILNEDVSCSHGATLGSIDQESLFYLQARGIAKNEAVRMIVSGFVTTTLNRVPVDLRERIETFVAQRLEGI